MSTTVSSSKALIDPIICHECELPVAVGEVKAGTRASCPRCDYVLTSVYHNAVERIMVFTVSALICLLFSTLFSFVQMDAAGQQRSITLTQTVQELYQMNEWSLAVFMSVIVIGLPLAFILALLLLATLIRLNLSSKASFKLLRFVGYLRFWNMAEIFFLGILISMVKVAASAEISLGLSFWAYALFNVFLILTLLHFDKYQLTAAIRAIVKRRYGEDLPLEHRPALSKSQSLQMTCCYLVTAFIFYVPANLLPIMVTSEFSGTTYSTIVSGVILMWEKKSYFVATIIFVASLVVPIAKFIALIGLCISEHYGVLDHPVNKIRLFRLIEFVGRWSMVDVFVVGFLASLVQMGNVMSVYPGPAALAFAAMVFFTMLAANSLDPRLFWSKGV